jgi:hypothetical protein
MKYILDRDRLVLRNKLVPGDAAQSTIYQRIVEGEMPPAGARVRPNAEQLALLKLWIEEGAPALAAASLPKPFLAEADIASLILSDLKTVPPRQRRFMRYFTFSNLTNAGVGDTTMATYRHALSKLINSLSWHPRISLPRSVDTGQAVVRIDLRDLQWSAAQWNRVLSFYPYVVPHQSAEFKAIASATACEQPYLRADWFVATAARPPLYHDLLQMPSSDRDLERQLRVDALQDIREERVARSGFNGSGVSRNNRLLERHDAAYGAYWRSYDFADNTERQNLFDHPLGPQAGGSSFEHKGGEIIFHLPNGLQGYMLVDANGRRLDRAPVEIVSDPKRPDRIVETGISCMSCHVAGVIHKADQIRAHVEKNPNVFSKEDREAVLALYPLEARFKALVDEDAERYRQALVKTGAAAGEPEPVSDLTLRYEGEVDLRAAAAEAGLPPEEFVQRLNTSTALGRILGPLKVPGGSVQRQVFQAAFADLVRELRLAEENTTSSSPGNLLSSSPALPPFAGHTERVLAIAFSGDGKHALSGSADRTARWWNLATGREIRLLEGHVDEVLAVALAPDGSRALTGSVDRTVRLWDLNSGRELRRFSGHTDRVSSVAFSPDGRRALSGSWDRTVILWDLEGGQQLFRLAGHTGSVSSVAFAADGRRALSGSHDRTVRLWDLANGQEIRRFDGPTREIYAVALAPDGRRATAGGNDQLVHLWDTATGIELRQLRHGHPVISVAFSSDGSRLLSGSSHYEGNDRIIRLWDIDRGQEITNFGGSETVWSIAFAPDGRQALSGSSDKTLHLWELSK